MTLDRSLVRALVVVLAAACNSGWPSPRPETSSMGAAGTGLGGTTVTAGAAGTAGAGGATGTGESRDGSDATVAAGTIDAAGSTGGPGATDGMRGPDGGVRGADGLPGAMGCNAPGTICWDFETGALPAGWMPYRDEFNGTLLVDNTRPHRGSYSLHAKDLQGGVEGQQGGPKKTIQFRLPTSFGPVLWGRAFVYTTPARPNSHAGLFNARYPRPSMPNSTAVNTLDWYEVATYMQKYMSIWHPPEPPGFPEWVQVADTLVVLDEWACLEWLFDGANGDNPQAADPRMFLNGAELTWPMTFVFSDPPTTNRPTQEKATDFTFLETGAYLYQGLPTTTNWWIDDLAVGKQRIGCD